MTEVENHPWFEVALFTKATLFVQRMEQADSEDDAAAIWSALALELLARATLAKTSPVLLADCDNDGWRQLEFALGQLPNATKFSPRSIVIAKVFKRLEALLPEFRDVQNFCATHIAHRNAELHTGEISFPARSQWLPDFYRACEVFCDAMGRSLGDITNDPDSAAEMIAALKDTAAKGVRSDIKAHQHVWEGLDDDDREKALAQSAAWVTRHLGHRTKCPACGTLALIFGRPRGPVTTIASDENYEITQRQKMRSQRLCLYCMQVEDQGVLQAPGGGPRR
jgi:hypothetical protein